MLLGVQNKHGKLIEKTPGQPALCVQSLRSGSASMEEDLPRLVTHIQYEPLKMAKLIIAQMGEE